MNMEFRGVETKRGLRLRLKEIKDGHFISYMGSEHHIGIKVGGYAIWPNTNVVAKSFGSDQYIDLGPYDLTLHQ